MPHKPSPAKRRRDRLRWEQHKLNRGHYVRKDGELVHIQGKLKFFERGEVIEGSGGRFLSPSHIPWILSQLAYEYYRKKEQNQKSMLDRLREEK